MESKTIVLIGYAFWLVVTIYIWVIVLAALVSWFSPDRGSPFVRFLDRLANPALNLVRRVCRLTFGGLDFTPLLLILFLYFIAMLVRLSCLNIGGFGSDAFVIFPLAVICLVEMVKSLCWFIFILMAVRVIMSLIRPSPYNPLVLIVYGATEPLLSPLKDLVPKGPWNLDLKAILFLAFLLLFDVFVLDNILKVSLNWGQTYGLGSLR
ncbi:MAG: YggT family protein [Deltaproteobacteria bacterium]|nr:YggT family protein [Deltaproteobacteria bacterium]